MTRPSKESDVPVASGPWEQPYMRAAIIESVVWSQVMAGILTAREQAEAAYDEALHNRHRIFEQ